ncbi:hypothetical protein [Sphingobium sp. YR768]|uniref:hypothetical protein n=1 Tax=Sphingobium sp. YR768 TaxID=1884365 RepID=UPI0008C599D9|nr:hypothetical protein [Sphingobium sp. YR768]SER09543.1 hypothetical protein SAMN05518866_1059 [Sphingobium sp. YR768]
MISRRREPAYCFGLFGKAKAPWRPTLLEAEADAVDAGYGSWCEHPVPAGKVGKIYLDPLAEIWTTSDLVPALPREVSPPGKPVPIAEDDYAGLSRIDRIIARREGRR